jgi:fumarate hydratase, class I
MPLISNWRIVENVAAALQYISAYHPPEYLSHLSRAYEREESATARQATEQILVNSRMASLGRRALCQDTGTVNIWLRIGMGVSLEGDRSL